MKMLTISKARYKRALEKAKQRGFDQGHLSGCVKVYNRAQTILKNAAAGGARPTGKMAGRLHDTAVDQLMTFGERVVQLAVDQIDQRLRAGKKLKVRFNGRTFRPSKVRRRSAASR